MPSTRRQFLAATAVSVGLAGCLSAQQPAGELQNVDGRWPMDGRDAGHTRRADGAPTDPETVWTRDFGGVRSTGAPAVSGGRLYVPADAVTDESRSRHRLYALSAATGETRWHVPLRVDLNGSPAVSGDRIVVSGRRSLERGRVVCFQSRYGEEQWLLDVDARLTAPPTVDDGVVYVPDWRGTVHAVGVANGSVLWSRRVGGDDGGRTFTEAAALHDGTLYLGSQSGNTGVVALDADTGEMEWRVSTGAVTGGPVVDDGLVLVQSHSLLLALGTDGAERWTVNLVEDRAEPLAVDDEHVYVPAGETLRAITRDGEESWRDDEFDGRVGYPTVAGNSVLALGAGRIRSLAAASGDEKWSTTVDGASEVIVTPEGLFLPTSGGRVAALGE